ncbi:tRNA pseudouridine(55) synthase TruB [soil metagenome]
MLKPSPKKNIDGVLLLDKPIGITSNKALQIVKRLFNASKAGHTGSLDPLATGMLPLCFGEATKFSQMLLDADKRYRVVAKLGITTTTGDAEGEVIESRQPPVISSTQLLPILQNFRGAIEQVPPMYSALKHQGQPLYKLARQGIHIERKARLITIHDLELEHFTPDSLTLTVHCSKGTYIRSLVEDIGTALGCGAHISYLRRLTVAAYQEQQMLTLETLQDLLQLDGIDRLLKCLLPAWSMLEAWPNIHLSETASQALRQGKLVPLETPATPGWTRLTAYNGEFLGIGEILAEGTIKPRRLVRGAG